MKSGLKKWSTIVDYFLVLGSIIGVGFASGKEIYVFFYDFQGASLFGLLVFGLLYIYLFLIIQYLKKKLKLNSYNEFNTQIFGKLCQITSVMLIINFTITSAGMLAGANYLFENFFGIKYLVPSIVLTIITFVLLIGGINKVKLMSNIIVPIMLAVIILNSIKNITPQNVNLPITFNNSMMAIYYGFLFGVNNFVAAMPMLFETKLQTKGKLFVIFSICVVILLNILVLASNNVATEMPMFELSLNVNSTFYYIYFAALILALFSTLIICSFNTYNIISKGRKSIFLIAVVVFLNLLISNLGYNFIVKYLYVISGIISGIYVVFMTILFIIKLLKFRKIKEKCKK